jgi:uncharacterized protein YqfA (UPF0365 family)
MFTDKLPIHFAQTEKKAEAKASEKKAEAKASEKKVEAKASEKKVEAKPVEKKSEDVKPMFVDKDPIHFA